MVRLTGHAIFLIFAALTASAGSWAVDVPPARTRLVLHEELAIYCRSEKEIEGCTELLGELLRCECHRDGGAWSMTARAQLLPYMYVTRPAIEEHEQLHIDDLRRQVGLYLGDLTAQHFADVESCRGAAEFEMIVFSLRMDLFRKLSNQRLH